MKKKIKKLKPKRKAEEKSFNIMNDEQKRAYLSNDMINRMIRVEQKVSSSFGQTLNYDQTNYYKKLDNQQREDYNKYLIRKKRLRFVIPVLFATPVLYIILSNVQFTGNVVNNLVQKEPSWVSFLMLSIMVIILFILIINFIMKRHAEQKVKDHLSVINDVAKKYKRKNF
jgi:hypothetical protein